MYFGSTRQSSSQENRAWDTLLYRKWLWWRWWWWSLWSWTDSSSPLFSLLFSSRTKRGEIKSTSSRSSWWGSWSKNETQQRLYVSHSVSLTKKGCLHSLDWRDRLMYSLEKIYLVYSPLTWCLVYAPNSIRKKQSKQVHQTSNDMTRDLQWSEKTMTPLPREYWVYQEKMLRRMMKRCRSNCPIVFHWQEKELRTWFTGSHRLTITVYDLSYQQKSSNGFDTKISKNRKWFWQENRFEISQVGDSRIEDDCQGRRMRQKNVVSSRERMSFCFSQHMS